MKAFFLAIFALLSCGNRLPAAAEQPAIPYVSPQVTLILRIKQLSEKGEYSAIYKALAPDYTGGMTEAHFVDILGKTNWRLQNVRTGAVAEFAAISYMPVRAEVVRRGWNPLQVDVVVFFRKTKTGWKLMNFPFLFPDVPPWLSIPEWFVGKFSDLP